MCAWSVAWNQAIVVLIANITECRRENSRVD